MVAPVPHALDRQLRALGQQRPQALRVCAVEDLATLDLDLEPRPTRKAMRPGDRQLGCVEGHPIGDGSQPSRRLAVLALGRREQLLRASAELGEIRTGRQVRHGFSLPLAGPRGRAKERGPTQPMIPSEVNSVLPADPVAPSSTTHHVSRRRCEVSTAGRLGE